MKMLFVMFITSIVLVNVSQSAILTKIAGVTHTLAHSPVVVPHTKVCIVEGANQQCTRSDKMGRYSLNVKLLKGQTTYITLETTKKNYVTQRSGTLELTEQNYNDPDVKIMRKTFNLQMVHVGLYYLFNGITNTLIRGAVDTNLCNVAGTIANKTKYDHWTLDQNGEPVVLVNDYVNDHTHGYIGAVIKLYKIEGEKLIEVKDRGPIYFNRFVIPDLTQKFSSRDGGFVIWNLEEGLYKLVVDDTGVAHEGEKYEINDVVVDCTKKNKSDKVFINLSPGHIHPSGYLDHSIEDL